MQATLLKESNVENARDCLTERLNVNVLFDSAITGLEPEKVDFKDGREIGTQVNLDRRNKGVFSYRFN